MLQPRPVGQSPIRQWQMESQSAAAHEGSRCLEALPINEKLEAADAAAS